MKKLLLAILLLYTLLLCVGCDTTPEVPEADPPTPIEPLPPAPTYNDPTHRSGAYKVTYIMPISIVVWLKVIQIDKHNSNALSLFSDLIILLHCFQTRIHSGSVIYTG